MPTLSVQFIGGNYHATPWGSNVQEGKVEWPPSPWRLLRALIAVGFAKNGWSEGMPEAARRLIEHLASVRPSFLLPRGGVTHTRHYMRADSENPADKDFVLDASLVFDSKSDPLLVHWDVPLPADELELLGKLASGLTYLGRAESWAVAEIFVDQAPKEGWTRPYVAGDSVPAGWSQTPVLSPVTPEEYVQRRERELATSYVLPTDYPVDLIACFCTDTATLKETWGTHPPGMQRVLYLRPSDALKPSIAKPRARQRARPVVESALLTLASDTEHGQLCPPMARALLQMVRLHDSAVSKADGWNQALTGRDKLTGEPLRGRHEHAHWIPFDLDGDGRIDHVLVYARMGLDASAQTALSRISRTWGKNLPEIVVSLAGVGNLDLVRRQLRGKNGKPLAELATSSVWESRTPFVAPRHIRKLHGRKSVEGQVAAECESRGLPPLAGVEMLSPNMMNRLKLFDFVCSRPDRPPPQEASFGLRLTFSEPVTGPLSLGYGSHFGLGLFAAVK